MSDPSATYFPEQGVDILIGGDLANSLNPTYQSQCQDVNSASCQQQALALLQGDDSLSLVARQVGPLRLTVAAIVALFSYAWLRLEKSTMNPVIGIHIPYSDYAQMSSWTDVSILALATTAGATDAVTVTLTESPLPTASRQVLSTASYCESWFPYLILTPQRSTDLRCICRWRFASTSTTGAGGWHQSHSRPSNL